MRFLRSIPAALAFLALGAHLLRAGAIFALAVPMVFIALLVPRANWALRICQGALLLGALEWVRVAVGYVLERRAEGVPFQRLLLILGAVALGTAASGLLLRPAVKEAP